jgi:hypothetical protein
MEQMEVDAIVKGIADKLEEGFRALPPAWKSVLSPNMFLNPIPVYTTNGISGAMIDMYVNSDRSIRMTFYDHEHSVVKEVIFA